MYSEIPTPIKNSVWVTHSKNNSVNCFCCQLSLNKSDFFCGYLFPPQKGGKEEISNLVPMCCDCHSHFKNSEEDILSFKEKWHLDNKETQIIKRDEFNKTCEILSKEERIKKFKLNGKKAAQLALFASFEETSKEHINTRTKKDPMINFVLNHFTDEEINELILKGEKKEYLVIVIHKGVRHALFTNKKNKYYNCKGIKCPVCNARVATSCSIKESVFFKE